MGQSLAQNYIHIVFSTKHRHTKIHPPYEKELHQYIAGTCKDLDCTALRVGGYTDHIHVLCRLSKNIALSQLIKELKMSSSKWMKTQHETLSNFYWQNGYGAFSVSPTEVDKVITYIENQHEHHLVKSFQEEYRAFLIKYKVDYDERYVWD
ncbi:IS200/IS605 family transposase [Roseivirga sp.]|uniref:IS200/IS605 family transposase n=1 Tax=Roseivirga sp. TaxID=1964215 RepID=UPI002B264E01|nr:IS200/IS605 family transposase [Roseivirga sp.]